MYEIRDTLKSCTGSLLVTHCTWTDEKFLHEQFPPDLLTNEAML